MAEFPKRGVPGPDEKKLEVITLACSSCGGQIDGPGKCPSCDQLLIVVEGGNYLTIKPEDIQEVDIKKPAGSDSDDSALWNFKIGLRGVYLSQENVWMIGNGNAEYGSHIVALFFKENTDKFGLAGQRVPKVGEIRQFAIKTALKQAVTRNNK
jgi:hypothetical protein